MTTSTDAILCYGISFEEGTSFPWDEDDDFEEWWYYTRLGFTSTEDIYDDEGYYLKSITENDPRIDKYYQERIDFKEHQPLCPYDLVQHCSYEYPMYILALSRTITNASRGNPEAIEPSDMIIADIETKEMIAFCMKYEIEFNDDPKWWLSSYWG